MLAIEATDAIVELVPDRVFRNAIERAADQVAEGVAPENVQRDQHNVYGKDDRANADSEAIMEPKRLPDIVDQEAPDDLGEAKEVAVEVLEHQREPAFAQVVVSGFPDGACRRVRPE